MNKKFTHLIWAVVVASMLLSGCQKSTPTVSVKNVKMVETIALSPSKYDVKLSYQGIVRASETRNYFFTSSGKVLRVYAKEGQYIKKGDILATLDTTQLDFANVSKQSNLAISENSLEKTISTYDTNIKNAEVSIETLKQSIEVAKSNLNVLKSTLEANETLYEAGGVAQKTIESQRAQYGKSEADFAALQSQLTTAQANLEKLKKDKANDINTAQENLNLSKTSMEQAQRSITDATLKAESDGYITKLAIADGDAVTANSAVITVKSKSSKVSIGVSAEDYNKLSSVKQIIIGNTAKGQIDTTAIYPDEATGTYKVDIVFASGNAEIGEIVDVDLVLGSEEGVFIPMESVINLNGVHYVYKLNDDNTVTRVQVDIKAMKEDKMLVGNLSNEKIVVSGIKTLNDNDVVSETSQTNTQGQNGGSDD